MTRTRMDPAFGLSWPHLEGRWRMPGSWTGRVYPDLGMFKEIASIAERGRIDMLFFGDGTGIPSTWRGSQDEAVRWGIGWPRPDISPYIPLPCPHTKHVGVGLTPFSSLPPPVFLPPLI